ncbi:MAG: YbjN domain-containing protein [Acidimicrobiales bacterium]
MTTGLASPLLDGLVAFLRDDGWPVTLPDGQVATVQTRCAGATIEWDCTGRTFEEQGQVVFDSALPFSVPLDRGPAMGLLLAAANWSLQQGAFGLDPSSGQVRLRTSLIATRGHTLQAREAQGLVHTNVLIVDRCLPTLQAAATGTLDLAEALERLHP